MTAGREGSRAVRWPPIPGLRYPGYSRTDENGVGWSTVFMDRSGRPEPLPSLTRMPGHVLYGWGSDDGEHLLGARRGHRWDSVRPGATVWGRHWSDQRIVDAIRDTVELPRHRIAPHPLSEYRFVRREVDGVLIEARWDVAAGAASRIVAYPVRGPGVCLIGRDGRAGPLPITSRRDVRFEEVAT